MTTEEVVANKANLSGADLSWANLSGANLSWANLSGADLRWSDLSGADLRWANLYGADLYGADLRGANLRVVTGNMIQVKSLQCDAWTVTYTKEVLQIGCQRHAIEEWWGFSDETISKMDALALAWWRVWKPLLQAIIKASPAS